MKEARGGLGELLYSGGSSAADQCGEEGISQRRRQQSAVHKQAAIDGEEGAKFSQGCCVRERDFRQAMYLSTKT